MTPDVAVVVVNYRSADLTQRCIAAVPAAAGDLRAEILVVENGSGDAERLQRDLPDDVELIVREDNGGFAVGVNTGFAATRAPVVLVINPDATLRPGGLQRLVAHLRANPGCALAAPRQLNADGSPQPSAYRRFPRLLTAAVALTVPVGLVMSWVPALDRVHVPAEDYVTGRRVAHVYGACMLIRRAAYDAVGPFDEGFFLYLEETEWQERAARAGWSVELVVEAEATHLVRGGAAAALAPPRQWLTSMVRYLALRGRPRFVSWTVLRLAATLSAAFTALLAAVRPTDVNRRQAQAWRRCARSAW